MGDEYRVGRITNLETAVMDVSNRLLIAEIDRYKNECSELVASLRHLLSAVDGGHANIRMVAETARITLKRIAP